MSSAHPQRTKPSQFINNNNFSRHLSPSRHKPSKSDSKLNAPQSSVEISRNQFFLQNDSSRGRSTRKRHKHSSIPHSEQTSAQPSSIPSDSLPPAYPKPNSKTSNMNSKQQNNITNSSSASGFKKNVPPTSKNSRQNCNASLSDSAVDKTNNPNLKSKKRQPSKQSKNQDNLSRGVPIDTRQGPGKRRQQVHDKIQSERRNGSLSPPVSKMSKSYDELKNCFQKFYTNLSTRNGHDFPPTSQPTKSTRRASFGADPSTSTPSTLYAGPTFHNSPAPSALPIPVFGMGTPSKSSGAATPETLYEDESGMFSIEDIGRNTLATSKSYPSLSSFHSNSATESEGSDKDDEDVYEDDAKLRMRSRQLLNLLSSASTAVATSKSSTNLSSKVTNNTSSAPSASDMYSQYANQPSNRIPNPYSFPSYSSFPTSSALASSSLQTHTNTHIHVQSQPSHANNHGQTVISGSNALLENELRTILRIDAKSS